jgi:hypothetical protein
LKFPPYYL